jgi:uroporphyrinogen III methyltransferase/synthase
MTGKVYLVGAGPGDAGLLSLRARQVLESAQVVVYDRLVGPGVLALSPPGAQKLYAGKESKTLGAETSSKFQEKINALLVGKAREGRRVVRLKGGDPFVFGRGGEEAEALKKAGAPFEVVPGLSSSLAVPACAGIALTHRDYASSLHIVTAKRKEGAAPINWNALAGAGGSLVFLMGIAKAGEIAANLMAAGLAEETPAAFVEAGSSAHQRLVATTLGAMEGDAQKLSPDVPALIIVGSAASEEARLPWRQNLPLSGVRIGVTRPRERQPSLAGLLAGQGAEVVEIPTIEIKPLPMPPALTALFDAGNFDNTWFAFSSQAGVRVFFARLLEAGKDVRLLASAHFAAIGNVTAAALEAKGVIPDLVPRVYSAASLAASLVQTAGPGGRVVLPRSSLGSKLLSQKLREAGIEVLDIPIYDTVPASGYEEKDFRDALTQDLDWLAFTSESTVACFAAIFGTEKLKELQAKNCRALCIGRQSAEAALRYGFKTLAAPEATIQSMVACLSEHKYL